MKLHLVEVDGAPVRHEVYGTTMRLDLEKPLAPGGSVEIEIAWEFMVPSYGLARRISALGHGRSWPGW